MPVLLLLVGLMAVFSSDLRVCKGEGAWSSVFGPLKRTLVNRRLVGVYSQTRFAASHLLHLGRPPEHFVLCAWHWLQALCALFLSVPASVWLCEGVVLETLSGPSCQKLHKAWLFLRTVSEPTFFGSARRCSEATGEL